jgi:hypothetical protein
MRHRVAPSSMREVASTSIHSSSQKGMRTHHPKVSRSRRDTPSVSISTRYVLIASMDVTPQVEPLFNEVYDTEHVPNLLKVPGVRSVTRMKGEPARFAIAGTVARVARA